jgi:hypothetical protein
VTKRFGVLRVWSLEAECARNTLNNSCLRKYKSTYGKKSNVCPYVTGHNLSRDTIMVSTSLVSSTLIYEVIINILLFFIYFSRNKTLQNKEKYRSHHTVDHSVAVANFQSRGSPFLQGDNQIFFNILMIQGNIS